MPAFGVHSEVGKLRTVIVHRPELSLKRLTPANHDELLFDDVLWVERAQWEHDQFVARMRERGVEVLYVGDLLAEALAADDDGPPAADRPRRVRARRRPGPGRRGPGLPGRARPGRPRPPPHRRPHGRRIRARPRAPGRLVADRRRDRRRIDVRPPAIAELAVHARLVVLDLRRRLGQPDVLARPTARGLQHGRDLPGPPHVPRRGLRVLVSPPRRRRAVPGRGLRARLARRRRRRDHRPGNGRDRDVRAHARHA